MENLIRVFTLLLLPTLGYSQDDTLAPDFLKGIKNLSYTTYDSDHEITSENVYKITSSYKTAIGIRYTLLAKDKSEIEPKKSTFHYLDQNQNELVFTANYILPPFLFDSYSNLDISIEEGNESVPFKFKDGDELQDEYLVLNLVIAPIIRTLKYSITDRQLIKEEMVTTPAGDFKCFVLESKTHFLPEEDLNGSLVQWFSPNVGLVKQTHYDLSGLLTGTTLLTGINVVTDKNPVVQN